MTIIHTRGDSHKTIAREVMMQRAMRCEQTKDMVFACRNPSASLQKTLHDVARRVDSEALSGIVVVEKGWEDGEWFFNWERIKQTEESKIPEADTLTESDPCDECEEDWEACEECQYEKGGTQ